MRFLLLLLMVASSNAALPVGVSDNPYLLLIPMGPDRTNTGTGFFMSHSNGKFLITARHVLFDLATNGWTIKGTNLLAFGHTSNSPIRLTFDLGALYANSNTYVHPSRDIAAVRLDTTNALVLRRPGTEICAPASHQVRRFTDIKVGETCYMFGYPTSVAFKLPNLLDPFRALARRAMIADADPSRQQIVLDAAVYKGNSGGPVMIADETIFPPSFVLVGLTTKFVPFVEQWKHTDFDFVNVTLSNSGYSIVEPVDFILELLDAAKL